MNQGSSATAVITVASVNGFDLATGLSAIVSPAGVGLTAVLSLNVVTPSSAGTVRSILTLTSQTATPVGTYQVTVSSSGGTKSHSTTVTVTVASADFIVTTPPNILMVAQGRYNTTVITVTSLAGFTGNVSLSATTPLAAIGVAGAPSFVVLTPGSSGTSILAVSATSLTKPGTYTVTVTGTSGLITHFANIQVQVTSSATCGTCGFESMSLDSASFNSGTNVTLYLRNTGTANITLVTYYVKDASGDQYSRTTWTGPTIVPNQVVATVFTIGSSCSSCTLVGSAFTFTAGNSYTVLVVTARNNQFSFTITR